MTRILRHTALTVSMAMAAMLTSCFTGIESTPRITADEVRRNTQRQGAADNYLADIRPESVDTWKPGKSFYVTDPRIGLAVNVSPAGAALQAGDTLRFRSAADVVSIMGTPVAEVTLDGPRGITATYRSDASLEALSKIGCLTIPFTVELSMVDSARERLTGNEYWVTTSEWLDMQRRPRRGRKFVKVRVADVERGDDVYPACLTLVDYTRQPADTFALLMALGNEIPTSSRRFANMMSLDDPHKRYPQVSDAMWELIRNGRVGEGMTRLEVRLSLGEPRDVQRRAGYSAVGEIWSYENGVYLIFEDGLLKQSRF